MPALFYDEFLHIKNVLVFILRFQSYLNPENLEKSYIHVSDNSFQIGKVTINTNTDVR